MTFWMNFGISAVAASHKIHGEYDWGLCWCAALTFIYLFKFFLWEIGYMRSIDIIEDNAGWYETWGCLVWVPCLYTNHMHCAGQRRLVRNLGLPRLGSVPLHQPHALRRTTPAGTKPGAASSGFRASTPTTCTAPDNAGWYETWGCLVWVPCLYTNH